MLFKTGECAIKRFLGVFWLNINIDTKFDAQNI